MATSKDETCEYVDSLAAELGRMAERAGLPFLAYLLKLAQAEAADTIDLRKRDRRDRAART